MPSTLKLLVFAHTPPPVHGQSLMVQTLVDGLASALPGLELHHVNPRLSRDSADIGRWRPGKFLALLAACVRALALRLRHGPMTFYYVPAPAKRGALYRDFIVMLLCRPFFPRLVFHWHAIGLGEWLNHHALERIIARVLLGRADLAIVLAPELAADAQLLSPRRTAVVPNGLGVPSTQNPVERSDTHTTSIPRTRQIPSLNKLKTPNRSPAEVLFLGLGSREKGLLDTLSAVALANRHEPGAFRLTVAGGFANADDADAFRSLAAELGPDIVRHVGFADEAKKEDLLASADIFCFPTAYPHEGQPLTLIEALAHDLPILTTRWRAIPGMLPASPHIRFVEPHRPDQIAEALLALRCAPPRDGSLCTHYLVHFTRERHLAALADALRSIEH